MKRRSYKNNTFYRKWQKKRQKVEEGDDILIKQKNENNTNVNPLFPWFSRHIQHHQNSVHDTYKPLFISKGTLNPTEKRNMIMKYLNEIAKKYKYKVVNIPIPYTIDAFDQKMKSMLTVNMKNTIFLVENVDSLLKTIPAENNFKEMVENWFSNYASPNSVPIIFTAECYNPHVYMLRSYCETYVMGYEGKYGSTSFPSVYRKTEYLLLGTSEGKQLDESSITNDMDKVPIDIVFRNSKCSTIEQHSEFIEYLSIHDTINSWDYYLEAKNSYDNAFIPLLCKNSRKKGSITDAKHFSQINYSFEPPSHQLSPPLKDLVMKDTSQYPQLIDNNALEKYYINHGRKEYDIPTSLKKDLLKKIKREVKDVNIELIPEMYTSQKINFITSS